MRSLVSALMFGKVRKDKSSFVFQGNSKNSRIGCVVLVFIMHTMSELRPLFITEPTLPQDLLLQALSQVILWSFGDNETLSNDTLPFPFYYAPSSSHNENSVSQVAHT